MRREQIRAQQHADQSSTGEPETTGNVVRLPTAERNQAHEPVCRFEQLVLGVAHFIGDDERRRHENLNRHPRDPATEVETDHLPNVLVHLSQRADKNQHDGQGKQRDSQLQRSDRRENRLHALPQRELGTGCPLPSFIQSKIIGRDVDGHVLPRLLNNVGWAVPTNSQLRRTTRSRNPVVQRAFPSSQSSLHRSA